MNKKYVNSSKELLEFIEKAPTAFHAVAMSEELLRKQGFIRLEEKKEWSLTPGGRYYVCRNDSAMIAFVLPEKKIKGFHGVAAHSDSPAFKLKHNPEMTAENYYLKLNVEKYGGMILSTWMDRPLSVAGRVIVKKDGELVTKLVNLDSNLCLIPNVAIHMNRDMNKGVEYNPQVDMLPIFADVKQAGMFEKRIAEAAGVEKEEILGSELFLYTREKGTLLGLENEYVVSPRLDDLQCVYCGVSAIAKAKPEKYCSMMVVFDNEEVGSGTKQGACSTFLKDTLERICESLALGVGEMKRMVADSFFISADNAHGVHPNHPEKADPTNRPLLNGGIVIKYHGAQKYTTDAFSEAFFRDICREAKVPVQTYHNRSDIAGGSTLGNLSTAQVPFNTVDIGLPQLAMHSAVETAGTKDTWYLLEALKTYFNK